MNNSRKEQFIATPQGVSDAPAADAQRSAVGVSDAPLGIKTKSSSTPDSFDSYDSNKIRRERFNLSVLARKIYAREGVRLGYEFILNYHRTAKCQYVNHAPIDEVSVYKSVKYRKSHMVGIQACGNVWTCAACAAKIQERRRLEISHAMDYFNSIKDKPAKPATGDKPAVPAQKSKQAIMVTFTFSHGQGDDLTSLLERQNKALTSFRSGQPWANFKKIFGFEGLIKSLEVTYGSNGYHPHTHELWFIDRNMNTLAIHDYLISKFRAKKHHVYRDWLLTQTNEEIFKNLILDRWEYYCEKNDLIGKNITAFRNRSVDVKFNAKDSDYLAKQDDSRNWGVDREIAKASTKKGRKKGQHPFSFLTKYSETGSDVWANRWLDYTRSFSGKRQLFWSPNLKDRVGIDDLDDKEIAAREDDEAYEVFVVGKDWYRVRNDVPTLLEATEKTESVREIKALISHIKSSENYDRESTEQERVDAKIPTDLNVSESDHNESIKYVQKFVREKEIERNYIFSFSENKNYLPDLIPYSMKDRYGGIKYPPKT